MPKQFSYPITFLPCDSIEEVRPFYEDILKLKVALEQKRCILFKIGESYWGFCDHYEEQILNPERVCLTLVVDTRGQVDSWHKRLRKSMVPCKKRPAYNPDYKIYNAFYFDPAGYVIEIQAFDEDGRPQ
ncbi:MAG: VOC family protein [Promethearchaeota archaeon]